MGAADRARARLVDGLRGSGRLGSAAVEEAFRAVPRHLFLPDVPLSRAYADEAVAVQAVEGVTTSSASQPSMMAIMLGQLDLRPGHRVLEIGAGTGYNAALMARLVGLDGRVVAVDIDPGLVDGARRHLTDAMVTGVELVCADGARGYPPDAPYDRIVLTVGSGDIRPEWVAQLAPGGRLLLPLAVRGTQLSVALDIGTDGILRSDSVSRCAFVRLRGVGAVSETGAEVIRGLSVLPADDRPAHPARLAAALSHAGPAFPTGTLLGVGDLWDGFGLWLALCEPATCRLLARSDDDHDLPDAAADFLPLGGGRATVGLSNDPPDEPGLAVVVLDPAADPDAHGPWLAQVRAYGPTGPPVADRALAACDAWREAGRPTAEDLALTVAPRAGSPPGAALVAGGRDLVAVVEKEHCRVAVAARGFPP
jgi:protein-L-isoaspartate(D-aspartate) O-methyltransferase